MYKLDKKVIIVEGKSDKKQIQRLLKEEIDIVCTYGTFGIEKFDAMLEKYALDDREVYIFVDADEPGVTLRKQLTRELPNARQLYIPEEYIEVELTPAIILASILQKNNIQIHEQYVERKDW